MSIRTKQAFDGDGDGDGNGPPSTAVWGWLQLGPGYLGPGYLGTFRIQHSPFIGSAECSFDNEGIGNIINTIGA